ncbi:MULTISPECIES: MBL fold metallo-hydrolase [Amycolatopsis]|uniref:MBL fold metallo-hydrolase n=1 Tax=Amycolatopsis dendrobii TaxID=2760662 RepID=A0A7W3W886_9PSEU|nr:MULTISPECIES: MBL fold metallo-hydrolase [Amycolatopsis]MBB1160142.1 MBL fold metallo-hydrolase [Amycolatopsis dendrobii]UKD55437.1 MBL fold metallo-hydrolase [Amycolatopsis sp. FU40]
MAFTVTVLGSATPYPRPDAPCSGYLVRHEDTAIWLDAGPGTLAALQEHVSPAELDAIWISHLHADHVADLLPAVYALLFADLTPRRPIPLYGPPGTAARISAFLSNTGRAPIEEAFAVRELHDGHRTRVGGLRLETVAVSHGFPAFGVRITDGERTFAYSGDTGPCSALSTLAKGTDLFLCEADSIEPSAEHLTPAEAGRAAAGAARLVLTHLGHTVTPRDAVRLAAEHFPGPVAYAAPRTVFRV